MTYDENGNPAPKTVAELWVALEKASHDSDTARVDLAAANKRFNEFAAAEKSARKAFNEAVDAMRPKRPRQAKPAEPSPPAAT